MTEYRCPQCGRPTPTPRRVVRSCYDCKQPITRHAKWTWATRTGVQTAVHRHCDNPESYYAKGEEPIAPAPLFDGPAEARAA